MASKHVPLSGAAEKKAENIDIASIVRGTTLTVKFMEVWIYRLDRPEAARGG